MTAMFCLCWDVFSHSARRVSSRSAKALIFLLSIYFGFYHRLGIYAKYGNNETGYNGKPCSFLKVPDLSRTYIYRYRFHNPGIRCLPLHGLTGRALDHRSLPHVFESRRGHIWRVFHLWLCFITFGGRSAHIAHHVHKRAGKTSILNHRLSASITKSSSDTRGVGTQNAT